MKIFSHMGLKRQECIQIPGQDYEDADIGTLLGSPEMQGIFCAWEIWVTEVASAVVIFSGQNPVKGFMVSSAECSAVHPW